MRCGRTVKIPYEEGSGSSGGIEGVNVRGMYVLRVPLTTEHDESGVNGTDDGGSYGI